MTQGAPGIAMVVPRHTVPTLSANTDPNLVKTACHINLGVDDQELSCKVESTVARSVTESFGVASEADSAGDSSDSGDSSTTLPLPGHVCRFRRRRTASSLGAQGIRDCSPRCQDSHDTSQGRPGSQSVSAAAAAGPFARDRSRTRSPTLSAVDSDYVD